MAWAHRVSAELLLLVICGSFRGSSNHRS